MRKEQWAIEREEDEKEVKITQRIRKPLGFFWKK